MSLFVSKVSNAHLSQLGITTKMQIADQHSFVDNIHVSSNIDSLWTFQTLENLFIDIADSVVADVDAFLTRIGVPKNDPDTVDHIKFLRAVITFDVDLNTIAQGRVHKRIIIQSVIASINSGIDSLEKVGRGKGNIRLCVGDALNFMEKMKLFMISMVSKEVRELDNSFQHIVLQFCQMCGLISWPGLVPPRKLFIQGKLLKSRPDVAFMTKVRSALGHVRSVCILELAEDNRSRISVDRGNCKSKIMGTQPTSCLNEDEQNVCKKGATFPMSLPVSNSECILISDTKECQSNEHVTHIGTGNVANTMGLRTINPTGKQCSNENESNKETSEGLEVKNPTTLMKERQFSLPLVASLLTGSSKSAFVDQTRENSSRMDTSQSFQPCEEIPENKTMKAGNDTTTPSSSRSRLVIVDDKCNKIIGSDAESQICDNDAEPEENEVSGLDSSPKNDIQFDIYTFAKKEKLKESHTKKSSGRGRRMEKENVNFPSFEATGCDAESLGSNDSAHDIEVSGQNSFPEFDIGNFRVAQESAHDIEVSGQNSFPEFDICNFRVAQEKENDTTSSSSKGSRLVIEDGKCISLSFEATGSDAVSQVYENEVSGHNSSQKGVMITQFDIDTLGELEEKDNDTTRSWSTDTRLVIINDQCNPSQGETPGYNKESLSNIDSIHKAEIPLRKGSSPKYETQFNIDHFRVEPRGYGNMSRDFRVNNRTAHKMDRKGNILSKSKESSTKIQNVFATNIANSEASFLSVAINSNDNEKTEDQGEITDMCCAELSSALQHDFDNSVNSSDGKASNGIVWNEGNRNQSTCIAESTSRLDDDADGNSRKRSFEISGLDTISFGDGILSCELSACSFPECEGSESVEFRQPPKRSTMSTDDSTAKVSFSFLKWLSDEKDTNTTFARTLYSQNCNQNSGKHNPDFGVQLELMKDYLPEFVKSLMLEWPLSASTPFCFGLMQYKTYVVFVCLELSSEYFNYISRCLTVKSADRGRVHVSRPLDILKNSDRASLMQILFRLSLLS